MSSTTESVFAAALASPERAPHFAKLIHLFSVVRIDVLETWCLRFKLFEKLANAIVQSFEATGGQAECTPAGWLLGIYCLCDAITVAKRDEGEASERYLMHAQQNIPQPHIFRHIFARWTNSNNNISKDHRSTSGPQTTTANVPHQPLKKEAVAL